MTKHLLLVDYENVHKVDLSVLDETYRVIIFVGAGQHPPKGAKNKDAAHRLNRVDFQKIVGSGKNALDFHIAFHLGRTFETERDTTCTVVSRDKGYDPLLAHLNTHGLKCARVASFDALVKAPPLVVTCSKCKRANTIEHYGGRWCPTCGSFASPPDPNLLPSHQSDYVEPRHKPAGNPLTREDQLNGSLVCGWCGEHSDMSGGIYDDGEWMCGDCIARYAR